MTNSSKTYKRVRNVPSKKFKKHLKSKADTFELFKEKRKSKSFIKTWTKDENLPNPFDVTKDFIKEKGLKIYGGLALHELLKKKKNPIYDKFEFPDYDVFSPNSWEHAKELCDRLFDMGFYFVEARSSILNDEKHQTYKVSVDMIYILDLTQSGCTSMQLKNKDCSKCGISKDNKCISIFNNIPCYNLLGNDETEYNKIFDYKNDKSIYPSKLFVCSPDWLKISMYREITEPLASPGRLEKVAGRLELFTKKYPYVANKCNLYDVDKKNMVSQENHRTKFKPVLEFLQTYLDKNNFINAGVRAYNFFINGKQNLKQLPLNYHEVYTQFYTVEDFKPILDVLHRKFSNYKFKVQENIVYWKEVDIKDYIIYGKQKNGKYEQLVVLTYNTECLPYIQYSKVKYVTLDRMKYHFFRNVALYEVIKNTQIYTLDYPCLLNNLINVEKEVKKKYPLQDKGKHRRFVLKCEGELLDKLMTKLFTRFGDKINLVKGTQYTLDEPKSGMITKTYPSPDAGTKLPFVPAERELKKYRKFSKKMGKYVNQKSYTLPNKPYLFDNANIL